MKLLVIGVSEGEEGGSASGGLHQGATEHGAGWGPRGGWGGRVEKGGWHGKQAGFRGYPACIRQSRAHRFQPQAGGNFAAVQLVYVTIIHQRIGYIILSCLRQHGIIGNGLLGYVIPFTPAPPPAAPADDMHGMQGGRSLCKDLFTSRTCTLKAGHKAASVLTARPRLASHRAHAAR